MCTQNFDSWFIHGRHADYLSEWLRALFFNWSLLQKVTCVCQLSEDSHFAVLQTCKIAKKFYIWLINWFVYFSNEKKEKPFVRLESIYFFNLSIYFVIPAKSLTQIDRNDCSEEFYTCCVEFLKEMFQQTDFLLGFITSFWNKTQWHLELRN